MSSPDLERGIRFKTNAMRGGTIENVFVRDVEIGETGSAIDIDMLYEEGAAGAFTPGRAQRGGRAPDGERRRSTPSSSGASRRRRCGA